MKRIIVITSLLFGTTHSAFGHQLTHKALTIVHPWVPETEASAVTLGARIKNAGRAVERLLRASTPIADGAVLLDEHGRETTSVIIPARGEMALSSKGKRIELRGIKKPLRAYDTFPLTLVFEKAGSVQVDVTVEEDSYR